MGAVIFSNPGVSMNPEPVKSCSRLIGTTLPDTAVFDFDFTSGNIIQREQVHSWSGSCTYTRVPGDTRDGQFDVLDSGTVAFKGSSSNFPNSAPKPLHNKFQAKLPANAFPDMLGLASALAIGNTPLAIAGCVESWSATVPNYISNRIVGFHPETDSLEYVAQERYYKGSASMVFVFGKYGELQTVHRTRIGFMGSSANSSLKVRRISRRESA